MTILEQRAMESLTRLNAIERELHELNQNMTKLLTLLEQALTTKTSDND